MTRARIGWALLVVAFVGIAAVLGALVTRQRAVDERTDGRLCARCHEAPADHGAHSSLACEGCHQVDDALARSLWLADQGLVHTPDHAATEACSSCHDTSPGSALATEGHRAHTSATPECASCHTDPHGDAAPVACVTCHADVPLHGPTAQTSCTSCHVFRASTPELAVAPDATVSHEADLAAVATSVGPDRVHGAMDCRRCHDPHAADAAAAPTVVCQDCHRGHLAQEQASAPLGHQTCTGCHQPHAPRTAVASDCLRCHTHPVPGQGWQARPPTDAGPQITDAEIAATRAGITHDGHCATCHEPHTWVASTARCASCHEENAASVAALPPDTHTSCTTCHEPHSPRPTAQVCRSCHTDVHVPLPGSVARAGSPSMPAAHEDCLSCHDPHRGRPSAAVACASCHQSEHVQLLRSTVQHQDCLSCHENHGAPLAPTAIACANCHADPVRAFATAAPASVPAEHVCANCHVPHAFLADGGAIARCASCHAQAVSAHASHRGTCTSCHENHGAPLGAAATCTGCHTDVHPTLAYHGDCTQCHQPHHAAVDAMTRCGECHTVEASAASHWPTSTPHHADCMACHQAHDETTRTTCASCHADRAVPQHMGAHEGCTGCHAPHRAPPETPSGWWARCADCHAPEATAVAGIPGSHGTCASCHHTPGPPLPTCVSCHSEPRPLNHAAHASERCSSCHASHGHPEITRPTCITCHADRADHFPDAPQCQSCHPFAR